MSIYKVTIQAYDYWYEACKSGWVYFEKYFDTKDKANEWIKLNQDFVYRNQTEKYTKAQNNYERPKFSIKEIEIKNGESELIYNGH